MGNLSAHAYDGVDSNLTGKPDLIPALETSTDRAGCKVKSGLLQDATQHSQRGNANGENRRRRVHHDALGLPRWHLRNALSGHFQGLTESL